MSKIKLGARPKNFKPFPVKFLLPDGGEAVILVTYKYRTRTEFGQMMNAMFADAGAERKDGEKVDFEKLFQQMGDKNADHLLDSMEAWDLDFDLSRESLLQMADEMPAGPVALMEAYRNACIEGRLGN